MYRPEFPRGTEAQLPLSLSLRQSGWIQGSAYLLVRLGGIADSQGENARARASVQEARTLAEAVGDAPTLAAASNNLGMACYELGDPVRAQTLHQEAPALYRSDGNAEGIAWTLERLGVVAATHGAPQQAARLLGAAAAARAEYGKASTDWEASTG